MPYFNLSIQDKPWKVRNLALDAVHNATRGPNMNQSPAACMFLKEAALMQQAKDQFVWKEPEITKERLSHRWTKQVVALQDELTRIRHATQSELTQSRPNEMNQTDLVKPAVTISERTWQVRRK